MPNWVTNKLRLHGPEEEIERLKRFLIPDGEDVDFNSIVTRPQDLNVPCLTGSVMKSFIALYLLTLATKEAEKALKNDVVKDALVDRSYFEDNYDMASRMISYAKQEMKSPVEMGKMYYDNLVKHGHLTWYDWSISNWGTKWNACETKIEGNTIIFETAWSGVTELMTKLSKLYPGVRLEYEYADEDFGYNCSRMTIVGGEIQERYSPTGGTDAARNLSFEILGWAPEEEEEDDDDSVS